MKHILLISFLVFNLAYSAQNKDLNITIVEKEVKVFGDNLFNGSFSQTSQHRYNPEYILNIGDVVNIWLWGAIESQLELTIDKQGNIFIPKIGTIHLLGTKNKDLNKKIESMLKKIYKNNVRIYANLNNFQPVSVFVSGGAVSPGLYEGLSSDSVLQFIDKAKGINSSGSFRNIQILRDNKIVSKVDLYEYLLDGKLDIFQFRTGDIINIGYLKSQIMVDGDVDTPLKLEADKELTLETIIKIAQPLSGATDVIVAQYNASTKEKNLFMHSIKDVNLSIKTNEHVKFVSNSNQKNIQIKIRGEHDGLKDTIFQKGISLKEAIEQIKFNELSSKNDIQLYRKNVAQIQKQLINTNLDELESYVFKAGSDTTDEALIRKQEAELILNFIEKARRIEPKGRVVLNKNSDYEKIILEEGDTIFVPKKSQIVTIEGEVKIPTAVSYVEGMNIEDYIEQCGGLSIRADKDNILVIKQNGQVTTNAIGAFSSQKEAIQPGDSILVLGKIDSKTIPFVKDITQIIYQIAVGAGVILKI